MFGGFRMGLFDVFKKKDCEICGKEVGVFGYKKLEDGEICKDCVGLLSPWFDDRRHSTVEQIKTQLAMREQNKKDLAGFSHGISFGDYYTIFVELVGGVPTRFVVSNTENYKSENADIISFKNLSSFAIDERERREEEKYTNDKGERVSHIPPKFTYEYDFYLKLQITGIPYIDEISFRLNRRTIELETVERKGILGGRMSGGFDPMLYPEYRQYKAMCDDLNELLSCGQRGVALAGSKPAPAGNPEDELIERLRNAPVQEAIESLSRELVVLAMNNPERSEEIRKKSIDAMTEAKIRLDYAAAGITPPKYNKPVETANESWRCFCGNVNTGRFCNECGIPKFAPHQIVCSECSWTVEDEGEVPSVCPSCDKVFGREDLDV